MQQLAYSALTHPGRVRTNNEDSVLASPPVFVVADGVGGSSAGEVASGIVVDEFAKLLPGPVDDRQVSAALARANNRILTHNERNDVQSATTAAGAVALDNGSGQGYWLFFNIGDSRVYRRTGPVGQPLIQVSVDHSRVQELLESGEISPEEAWRHPERNVVTRAVGSLGFLPDFWLMPRNVGERIMICSDGLLNDSPGAEVKRIVKEVEGAERVAQHLLALALHHGARDNATVIVIDVLDDGSDVDSTVPMAQTVLTARRNHPHV
ncbi:PP2C family protein-serine/threonine phosphatase [Propionibacteriaceae bacterium Y2011]